MDLMLLRGICTTLFYHQSRLLDKSQTDPLVRFSSIQVDSLETSSSKAKKKTLA